MKAYIKKNTDGDIILCSQEPFEGSVEVDYGVVRGWDGRLYKAGEEPTPPAPSIEDQLAAIEAKYAGKQAELDSALVNALWVDGPQEASIRGSLMAKRQKLIDDRDAEIAALFA